MAYTLLASQVPEPGVTTAVYSPVSPPVLAPTLLQGDTDALIPKFNEVATRLDLTGRYGGGLYGVAVGLTISAGAGLVLNIAAGTAMIDGPVCLPSGTTTTLLDGHTGASPAGAYIYLSQGGAVAVVYDSLTPPAGRYVYLGRAQTSGGSITSVDLSGVIYLLGTGARRYTADTTTPTDTPAAEIMFVTIGNGGTWLWTGTSYVQINLDLSAAVILAPGSSTRNLVQATGAFVDLVLRAPGAGTPDLLDFQNAAGTPIGGIDNGAHFLAPDGLVTSPGFSFLAEATSGLSRGGAGTIQLSTLGTAAMTINGSQLIGIGGSPISAVHVGICCTLATNKGIVLRGASLQSANLLEFQSVTPTSLAAFDPNALFLAADGAAATPGIAFLSDPTTGMYRIGASTIGWATGATEKARLDGNGFLGVGTTAPAAMVDANRAPTDLSGTLRSIRGRLSPAPTADTSGTYRTADLTVTLAGGFNYTGSGTAIVLTAVHSGTATVTTLQGMTNTLQVTGGGTVTTAFGAQYNLQIATVASTITTGIGISSTVLNSISGGTITTADGFRAAAPSTVAGSTIGTLSGLRVRNQGTAQVTTSNAILIEAQSGAGTTNAILCQGGQSTFQTGAAATIAAVFQGAASQSANLVEYRDSSGNVNAYQGPIGQGKHSPRDAVTNAITTAMILGHNSSGTPAAGFGTQIQWQLKSSTTEDRSAMDASVEWVVATDASRTARAKWSIYDTAAREAMRIEASGSAAMIGFLGAAAIARPAAYTLAGSATRVFPTDPSAAYTGINNAQAGTPYAQVTDLNTLRTAVSTLIGVVRQMATDLGNSSGYGLLNA